MKKFGKLIEQMLLGHDETLDRLGRQMKDAIATRKFVSLFENNLQYNGFNDVEIMRAFDPQYEFAGARDTQRHPSA